VGQLLKRSHYEASSVIENYLSCEKESSHRQFKHSEKAGAVTVAGKESLDVPRGTLNSILKQAGLKRREDQA
jgi:predicted RNA binding protein YcfA (HicA-like mRNA interferase family)